MSPALRVSEWMCDDERHLWNGDGVRAWEVLLKPHRVRRGPGVSGHLHYNNAGGEESVHLPGHVLHHHWELVTAAHLWVQGGGSWRSQTSHFSIFLLASAPFTVCERETFVIRTNLKLYWPTQFILYLKTLGSECQVTRSISVWKSMATHKDWPSSVRETSPVMESMKNIWLEGILGVCSMRLNRSSALTEPRSSRSSASTCMNGIPETRAVIWENMLACDSQMS